MHEAKEQSAAIIDAAHKRSSQIIDEAKDQARAEASRLVAAAKADIQQQEGRVREELRSEIANLALVGAEKVLASSVDAANHKDIVDKFISELHKGP